MKAAVFNRFGSGEVIEIKDVPTPVPKDGEVLVKVRSASINPLDWRLMKGKPYAIRVMTGMLRPKDAAIGVDLSGEVESVGKNVTDFKPGDEVFGTCPSGACAEYTCSPETKLVTKPNDVTFDKAASLPVAGLTALQGLRDKGKIREGQNVLINGAAGGVGTFAVQIAKSFGAEVTGVCSTGNVEMVRSIGADRVIDYTKEDFTEQEHRYDLIFDCVANHRLSAIRRVLKPKGALVVIGAPHSTWMISMMAPMFKAVITSPFVSQNLGMFVAKLTKEDLSLLGQMTGSGTINPVIDRRYSLDATSEALEYLIYGHAKGKVLINCTD